MIKIENESVNTEKVQSQYNTDKKNVEDFLNGKSPTFNYASLRRLVLSELSYNKAFKYQRICGFTRRQIQNITQSPEQYGNSIIKLSEFMMLKSGYYKRLVEYFINSAIINWIVDKEVKNEKFLKINKNTYRKNYLKYVNQVNKFKLDVCVRDIFYRLYVDDVCYAFVTEDDVQCSIFYIEPKYCQIERLVNGNVYEFSVNRSLMSDAYIETLPAQLQDLLEKSKSISLDNRVMIPYENSLCLKYHNEFTYLYPPFFGIIGDILNIEDYKELSKAKTEADAYKLLYFKIPTEDGKITMGDDLIIPFIQMASDIVPKGYGVIPAPMDLQLIESKSTVTDDKNKVDQAEDNYYSEAGISRAVISSASSGSELKLSMKVDSSDIYRLYHQIEVWMNLQMKLRGFIYDSYDFIYRILPTTIFDVDDYIDSQLKLAQASFPVKDEVMAAKGINPAKMIGATLHEQLFDDIYSSWKPMATSYTQSGDSNDEGGRPEMNDTEITETTEQQRANESNKTENRI